VLNEIAADNDPNVRAPLLIILAQTGDKRALDVLLGGLDLHYKVEKQNFSEVPYLFWKDYSEDGYSAVIYGEIARGLARIGDSKALPALAKLAKLGVDTSNDALTWEAVTAFGYISHRFKAPAPVEFNGSNGIQADLIKTGLADIADWEKMNMP
jgi:HEAT repeat protein